MNVLLHTERKVRAAPDSAYALSLDAQRFPSLFTGCGPIPGLRRITLHGPLAVGVARDVEDTAGVVMCERVDALEPAHRHAYTLSGFKPPLAWLARVGHAEWTFEPMSDGTRVTWTYVFALTSFVAWPVAAPLLHTFMRAAMQRCLDAMARALESA